MEDSLTPWPEWHIDKRIGKGNYGIVWRASRKVGSYTTQAAIKVIDIPHEQDEISVLASMGMDNETIRAYLEGTANSLLREVAAMERLKGAPGVVVIEDHQLVRDPNDDMHWTLYIRMELLEPLRDVIEREGAPSPEEAARIGVDLCHGLAFCHAEGVIHRDVKPTNVFRSRFGEYKLGDFGIADRLSNATQTTKSYAGSPAFMAPEVSSGHYDRLVDVYSLGIMLYRWLNGGRPPFVPADGFIAVPELDEAERRRSAGERPPLPAGNGVDPELAAIVRRAVEPRPPNRWQSADAFGEALQGWLARDVESVVDDEQTVYVVPEAGPRVGSEPVRGEDIHIDLVISESEADAGTRTRVDYAVPPTGRIASCNVDVPAGTRDGKVLRCTGKGCLGSNGGDPGDLVVRVFVAVEQKADSDASSVDSSSSGDGADGTVWVTPGGKERVESGAVHIVQETTSSAREEKRQVEQPKPMRGKDVRMDLEITEAEARQGTIKQVEYDLPSNGGRESCKVQVPRGSVNGDHVRVSGMGGRGTSGGERGDLVVRLAVRRNQGGGSAMLTRRAALFAGGALGLVTLAVLASRKDHVSADEGSKTAAVQDDEDATPVDEEPAEEPEQEVVDDQPEEEPEELKPVTLVAISAGSEHTVGLRSDGTAVATGENDYGQCDVSGWRDLVAVSAGLYHTVGLRSDGTAVATGYNYYGRCDVSDWRGLVAVSAGHIHTVGLRSDGTAVATGGNGSGRCDVSGWGDLVAVSAGGTHTVGLRSDGTAVATGDNEYGQCDVSGW